MKRQWAIITGIIIVLIIAIFAVINVDPVEVNYLFGRAEWPLVLVIISSVLMGGLITGSAAMYKLHKQKQEIKRLKNRLQSHDESWSEQENEVASGKEEEEEELPGGRVARKRMKSK
ncbi:lipopolysaccharide assembly LapA domain-containing protein [Evansella clarkii]|uniref:LapA family protein n=1 Tax=Evansella clarkii TaxID=79879 RepID=UPI000B44BC72|nr:lipopolysaccharide assembly protein LapA domain-containing protein [Evansella clarkii]